MQKLRFSKYIKGIIILIDIIVILGILTWHFYLQTSSWNFQERDLFLILFLILFWILLSGRTKLYSISRNTTYTAYLERFITHLFTFILGIILISKVSDNLLFLTKKTRLAILLFTSLFFIKSFIFLGIKYIRSRGVNHRNVMFIGSSTDSRKIIEYTLKSRKDYGYKIFDYPFDEINLDELIYFWTKNGIHTLFISLDDESLSRELLLDIKENALLHHIRVILIPNVISDSIYNQELSYMETQPILVPSTLPLEFPSNYWFKRIFDIAFSLLVLIGIGSWLFPIIAIIIKLTSKGKVFFKQKRYGYKEEVFHCLKFRTMEENAFSDSKVTAENDNRITKFGRFLRKTSLDELPQFINVLKGEMSVVGPRPHMLAVDDYYKTKIGRYTARSLAKPGITGLAQVNGLRGDQGDRNLQMKKRILADVYYVKNWSFVLDMVIILKTLLLLLKGDEKAN